MKFSLSVVILSLSLSLTLSRWMNKLRPSWGKCLAKLCLERRTSQIIIHRPTLNSKYPKYILGTSELYFSLKNSIWTERIESNRIEYLLPLLASRLKNLLRSKFYLERFNSLATCYSQARQKQKHRYRVEWAQQFIFLANDKQWERESERVREREREGEKEFILGNFWHAAKKVAQVWNSLNCQLAAASTSTSTSTLTSNCHAIYHRAMLLLLSIFVFVCITLAFVLYLFSISRIAAVYNWQCFHHLISESKGKITTWRMSNQIIFSLFWAALSL